MKIKYFSKLTSWILALVMLFTILPANLVFASETTVENGTLIASREDVEADIRIGIFGDTHVTVDPIWTTAEAGVGGVMEAYKIIDSNMDAFAMPGDVIFNVDPAQEKTQDDKVKYQAVIDKMKEDFPALDYSKEAQTDSENKNKVIWSMGNHEITLGAYENSVTTFDNGRTWQQEVANNVELYEEFFGHDACYSTTVNGYTFVTAEPYDYLNNYVNPADKTVMSALEAQAKALLEAGLAADETKPVFYLQHEMMDQTGYVGSSTSPMRNSAEFQQFVLSNPRIVVISGHAHLPSNDPRLIWQAENGSTHINIPAAAGSTHKYGTSEEVTETSDATRYHESASHAILLEANGAEVALRRFDVKTKKYIGEPIVFTPGVADAKYTSAKFTTAKESTENKPYFNEDAAISVSDITNSTANVSFPIAYKDGESAEGLQDSFVHLYTITVTNKNTGNVTKTIKKLEDFWRADANKRTVRSFSLSSLSRNTEYEISIVPSSSLGQKGDALVKTFTTTNEKTAEELALTTKTDLKNVASGKTPTSTLSSASNLANIVDGDVSSMHSGTYNSGDYILFDLGRRYNIEKIVLNAYNSGSGAKRGFVLEASNDPAFPEGKTDKLYECAHNVNSNEDFDGNNNLTLNFSGSNDYRYLRYRRTVDGWYIYVGEFQVYAREYITEVSRNKPVEANISGYNSTNPASYAVNGKSDKGWWSAYPGEGSGKFKAFGTDEILDYLVVDLEASLPVSLIEIEYPKGIADNTASRQGWSVYGSTELPEKASSTGTNVVTYRPDMVTSTMPSMFTQLCSTGTGYYLPQYGTTPLKMKSNLVDAVGYVKQNVNTAGNVYRYITFKKLNKNIAQLGEVRAFVTNPTLNSVKINGDAINLSFSDAMDTATLTSDNIKIYNTSGVEIEDAVLTPSADGCEVAVTNAPDAQKVEINYNLKSALNVEIAGTMTRYIARDVNLEGKPIINDENVNIAMGKQVTVSGITEENYSNGGAGVVDGSASSNLYGSFTASSSITIDLENRYNIKRVVLKTSSGGNQTGQLYEIQLSNDENFVEYDVAHHVGGLVGDAFNAVASGADITLDGTKDYRYVRYQKNAACWAGIEEIEVYADRSLMEISRNATAVANAEYASTYGAQNAVDGKNAAVTDGWTNGWPSNDINPWLYVDLGASYPITRIEMESLYSENPFNAGGGSERRFWNVYGSKTMNTDDLLLENDSGVHATIAKIGDGYDLLGTVKTGYMPYYNEGQNNDTYYTFAEAQNSGANTNGILRDDVSGEYRYITFQKAYKGLAGLGEVRVYTPAAQANSVRLNGNEITVSFSDKMFPENINSETVVLKDASGNVLSQNNGYAEDYEYTFTTDGLKPATTYYLTVSSAIKSLSSMPISAKTITFTTPAYVTLSEVSVSDANGEAPTLKANTAYTLTAKMASTFETKTPVMVVIAEKDASHRLVKAYTASAEATAKGTSTLTVPFTTGETVGSIIEVYVWDETTLEPYSVKVTK